VDVKVTVEHAALDPFRGYANAIRDELPDAAAVLDALHVVKLAARRSMRSDAASNSRPCTGVATRTTRCTRSAAPFSPATSTSPTGNANGSTSTADR
jgi:transposase